MKAVTKIFVLLVIFVATMLTSGCLGYHGICPHCEGLGLDPDYIFFTECPVCGGDGEVGLFINNEHTEDILSYIVVFLIGLGVTGVIIGSVLHSMKSNKTIVQPVVMQQPNIPLPPPPVESPLNSEQNPAPPPSSSNYVPRPPRLNQNIPLPPSIDKVEVHEDTPMSICPYCGKALNFPKPPKFCPYCKEQITRY